MDLYVGVFIEILSGMFAHEPDRFYAWVVVFSLVFWFSFTGVVTYQCWNSDKYTIKQKIAWFAFFLMSIFFFLLGPAIYAEKNYKSDMKFILFLFTAIAAASLIKFMVVYFLGVMVTAAGV